MNPGIEEKHFSRTAKRIHKIGHDSIRLLQWMAFYGEF